MQTPPSDIEASWDLDGVDLVLPGPGLTRPEVVGPWLSVTGFLTLMLAGLTLARPADPTTLGVLASFVAVLSLAVLGMMGLGHVRARGTPVKIRIEPLGETSITWMHEPLSFATSELQEASVSAQGPPQVNLVLTRDRRREWRTRTAEQAIWLSQHLDSLLDARQARAGDVQHVPNKLAAMRES